MWLLQALALALTFHIMLRLPVLSRRHLAERRLRQPELARPRLLRLPDSLTGLYQALAAEPRPQILHALYVGIVFPGDATQFCLLDLGLLLFLHLLL